MINLDSDQQITLENEQRYQSWKKELTELENIDWESDNAPDPDSVEYIGHRIQCLRADISAYKKVHAIIHASSATPEMDDVTYWNTIALANDKWNGDL